MLPKQQRRAEPPKAFPPHANVADPASRVPPYGVFPSNTSAYGSCSPVPPSEKRNFRARPSRESAARSAVSRSILPSLRSEEHTSELQSLMRISYAVFCLNKKNQNDSTHKTN